ACPCFVGSSLVGGEEEGVVRVGGVVAKRVVAVRVDVVGVVADQDAGERGRVPLDAVVVVQDELAGLGVVVGVALAVAGGAGGEVGGAGRADGGGGAGIEVGDDRAGGLTGAAAPRAADGRRGRGRGVARGGVGGEEAV